MLFATVPEADHPYNIWISCKSTRPKFIRLTKQHNVILEAVRVTFDHRARADACREVLRDRIDSVSISRPNPKALLSAAITGASTNAHLTPADIVSIATFLSQALQMQVIVVHKGQLRKFGTDSPSIIAWSVDNSYMALLNADNSIDEQLQRLHRTNRREND